jgi:hypothetical protein
MRRLAQIACFCVTAAAVAALAPAASAAPSPLSAYWPLNEGRGQTVYDWSGNGNHGTLGSSAGADSNDPSWITGKLFLGLRFAGDDFVRVPGNPSLETPNVTVAAFVRGSTSPGMNKYIFSKGGLGCAQGSYGLYSGPNNGLMFVIGNQEGFVRSPDAGTGVWDGKWHLVAGTYDGNTVRVYVDGVQAETGTSSNMVIDYSLEGDGGSIGTFNGDCDLNFRGDLDEVSVWNKALPMSDIYAKLRALGIRL